MWQFVFSGVFDNNLMLFSVAFYLPVTPVLLRFEGVFSFSCCDHLSPQGEIGEPGQKGSKGDKGEHVSHSQYTIN